MKTSSTTRWGTWTGAVLFALLAVARPAIAADPLVNVDWVKANLDKPGIVYVDFQPPAGVTVDPKRRPYVIIDPRAGHGPGIGGFKDDSQVGVALREGHQV